MQQGTSPERLYTSAAASASEHSHIATHAPVPNSYVKRCSLLAARPVETICDGVRGAGGDVAKPHAGSQHGPLAFIRPSGTQMTATMIKQSPILR